MVDVSDKAVTARTAIAEGFVSMAPKTLDLILGGKAEKGDVLAASPHRRNHGCQAHRTS